MNLYELVFIARQDISTVEVDKFIEEYSKIVTEAGGSVEKNEYWGLRELAYEIKKNRKGHYVLLGLKADIASIKEIERKIKLNTDIIRHVALAVDEIKDTPSDVLKTEHAKSSKNDAIDVTT